MAFLQVVSAGIAAALIGSIVKECAFVLCERVMTALGYPFMREGLNFSGRAKSEVWFPDGTWIRSEAWRDGAVWEWTERDGSCTRVESPAMTVTRVAPYDRRTADK